VKKILIVDDEQDILDYLTMLFKDNDYETVTAGDGKEAFEIAKKEKPDLITLDIVMPKESGVRFYRDAKSDDDLKNIPIIIITALTGYGYDPEGFHKFIKSRKQVPPPEGFMAKPVDTEELLKLVKKHIA
jgi:CheY-like chemotaxis protein